LILDTGCWIIDDKAQRQKVEEGPVLRSRSRRRKKGRERHKGTEAEGRRGK